MCQTFAPGRVVTGDSRWPGAFPARENVAKEGLTAGGPWARNMAFHKFFSDGKMAGFGLEIFCVSPKPALFFSTALPRLQLSCP